MSDDFEFEAVFLRAMSKLTPILNRLRSCKRLRMSGDHWRVTFIFTPIADDEPDGRPSVADAPRDRNTVRDNVLRALGSATMKGEQIARKAGYSYSGHFRGVLSEMKKDGDLALSEDGYSNGRLSG